MDFIINFISIFIFTIIFSFFINWPKPINDTVIKGKIVDLDEKSVVVKTDETKVKVYGNFIGYHLDDELEMEVEYFEINEPTNDNAFNYKNYLYSQGITNNASIKRLLDVNTKETLFQKLQERISSNDLIDSYASMFVLGIKDEVIEDYYQQLTDLSVVHLFALSGLHIHLPFPVHMQFHYHNLQNLLSLYQSDSEDLQTVLHIPVSYLPVQLFPADTDFQGLLPV